MSDLQLSPRERVVARMVAEGYDVYETAGVLRVSESAVYNMRFRIFKKLNCRGVVDLTHRALREGWVTLRPGLNGQEYKVVPADVP